MVYGQNVIGQNGRPMDKMVHIKWYMDKMSLDKMVGLWTKWYGQNGSKFWNRLQLR